MEEKPSYLLRVEIWCECLWTNTDYMDPTWTVIYTIVFSVNI